MEIDLKKIKSFLGKGDLEGANAALTPFLEKMDSTFSDLRRAAHGQKKVRNSKSRRDEDIHLCGECHKFYVDRCWACYDSSPCDCF